MSKNIDVFKKQLDSYRKEIDRVDNKIIKLLEKRGELAIKIGKVKKKYKKNTYQPEREKDIIERMKSKSKILKEVCVESIWREIISGCKLIQEQI